MNEFTALVNAISAFLSQWGLNTTLIVALIIFVWYKGFPWWSKIQEADRQREIDEIKALREDARSDKKIILDAFIANTAVQTQLGETLKAISTQMAILERDMSQVYRILGERRGLTEKNEKEKQ